MHGWLLPSTSMDDWRSRIFLRLSSNCTVEFTVTVQFMFGYIAKLKKSADNRFSVAGARSLEGTARACVTSVHNCDDCPRYCAWLDAFEASGNGPTSIRQCTVAVHIRFTECPSRGATLACVFAWSKSISVANPFVLSICESLAFAELPHLAT